ncbi:four-helix bundle copper-binding protein [Nocardia huaxiensis]|uniref:Four-helix bundle copper-binding protein n=1 Tax=Nocardia huaxiensis TaxID=2755382 RepID=A0A7D6VDB6_9NOCA|nr:four-helix bundle copper-binding protein [Nocardia huaxiensis]QLY33761.1 four-helix bundle copper-binding protein [Nocardia huaxiensis]UFS99313.1 hypothetical protein LPY97_16170 [Nocardia huaxiensis]
MTDPKLQSTINALLGCHRSCIRQVGESIDKGGNHAARTHITALMDCADVCRLAGDMLDRHSTWTSSLCELAAEVCSRTADTCERLGEVACANACRAAADLSADLVGQFAR